MTLADNETLDLTEFEFEIPCERGCDLPARWVVNWRPKPCACEGTARTLNCDDCKRLIHRDAHCRTFCKVCNLPTGRTVSEAIASITPIKPGGAA